MSFTIKGLDDLQREMQLPSCRPTGAEVLDGKITTSNFAPSDLICVERTIVDMKPAFDRKVSGCCGSLLRG